MATAVGTYVPVGPHIVAALLVIGLAGCAAHPAAHLAAPRTFFAPGEASAGDRSPIPRVDHHQHLMSPAMARHWSQPARPAVDLPEGLDHVLRRRAAAFGDSAALADLYAADAVLLDVAQGRSPMHSGRDAVARWVSILFASPYRVTPVGYEIDGGLARISGYVTREADGHARHFAHLSLALRREADGVWRIAEETLVFPGPALSRASFTAADLVALLDAAGIERAAVLSVAYGAASPRGAAADAEAMVRRENDWTVQQAALHPHRLVPFCSVNPLLAHALDEIDRCAGIPAVRGIKLHFGNSDVNPLDAEHAERARKVFAAASAHALAIVVHLSTYDRPYTPEEHEAFLERILPAADVPVQIAHLGGWGGFSPTVDGGLDVYARAIAAGDPRTHNLWFDVTTVAHNLSLPPDGAERVATRIRQLGPERVLYGSDMPLGATLPPRGGWAVFRGLLPLTDEEFAIIANNVAPHMR